MATVNDDLEVQLKSLAFAKFFQAFTECSAELQNSVRELVSIVVNGESDDDERYMALSTIADILFPNFHEGTLGIDLEESERMEAQHSPDMREGIEELDRQEASFAERLGRLLDEKGMTQVELAKLVGVGQPAISMMLNRQCRPQQRTVERIAGALNVAPEDLWASVP